MRLNTFLSFAGFVILIAGTYCPIVKPILGNWDVYDGNKSYGIVILLIAVVGIIGTVFNEQKIIRLSAWLSLVLVILFYFLAILKVRMSFNFVPLHFVAKYLTSKLKFKWGWYLLFGGPLLAIAGMLLKNKALNNFRHNETNT
jgi:predicted membrane channel-forming protein YqfA (hemolysin III family)